MLLVNAINAANLAIHTPIAKTMIVIYYSYNALIVPKK
jgi:hypothetical protein